MRQRMRKLYRQVRWAASLAAGIIRARLPNIRRQWNGDRYSVATTKHAVFVHFDVEGVVHDYVVKYLEEIRDCGFEITFVSNSPKLPDATVALLKPLCRLIVHRFNSGYDFAAYRDGIGLVPDLENCDALILANDSVYGPLFPLKQELAKLDSKKIDVWGITDSWQHNYHVQSYFICLFRKAIASDAFRKFWRNFPNINDKQLVVQRGEIRLTQVLAREKLRIAVQCPYWDVASDLVKPLRASLTSKYDDGFSPQHIRYLKAIEDNIVAGVPMNQSHSFWETNIRERRCLFIKRELIQKNPMAIPFVWRWEDVIDTCTDYDCDLIRRHLHSL